jgi:hypothetical protein
MVMPRTVGVRGLTDMGDAGWRAGGTDEVDLLVQQTGQTPEWQESGRWPVEACLEHE